MESDELSFNVDHGYLEGLVRGCKAGLLTRQDYANLVQCETLEGKAALLPDEQEAGSVGEGLQPRTPPRPQLRARGCALLPGPANWGVKHNYTSTFSIL